MKIGDKVVCVRSRFVHPEHDFTRYRVIGETANVEGRIYVIASFHVSTGELGLGFIGSRCFNYGGTEVGWNALRFRLLDELREESTNRRAQDATITVAAPSVPSRTENQPVSPGKPKQ